MSWGGVKFVFSISKLPRIIYWRTYLFPSPTTPPDSLFCSTILYSLGLPNFVPISHCLIDYNSIILKIIHQDMPSYCSGSQLFVFLYAFGNYFLSILTLWFWFWLHWHLYKTEFLIQNIVYLYINQIYLNVVSSNFSQCFMIIFVEVLHNFL